VLGLSPISLSVFFSAASRLAATLDTVLLIESNVKPSMAMVFLLEGLGKR
jgi:ABC-type branched-subunit amino acid transport system ATPase component